MFFRIDPDGKINLLGTFDKIRINDFQPSKLLLSNNIVSCLSPKRSLMNINVEFICKTIGERLYQKGLMGYI
jgi:hypothetical protein